MFDMRRRTYALLQLAKDERLRHPIFLEAFHLRRKLANLVKSHTATNMRQTPRHYRVCRRSRGPWEVLRQTVVVESFGHFYVN